ncbi:UNVERIFIED_CONTAM: hypothetical protein Sangu_1115200 [Sesamum angustifolium]|uniref:Bifunctional inhibitor/plant lipid transfer protein/seed storage helical domain-containing protein n=1 Tax=Sesamum angustifolium TaxID=2727405 RepID=A0AAW2NYR3_9LAMI
MPFRIPINQSLAISLPRACNMSGVPLQCKAAGGPVPAPASGPVANGPSVSPNAAPSPSVNAAEPVSPGQAPQADATPTPPAPTTTGGAPTSNTGSRAGVTPSAAHPSYSISLFIGWLCYCLELNTNRHESYPPPPPPLPQCHLHRRRFTPTTASADELVTFSSCLPYVAVFPNNLTDSPSPLCCDDVAAVLGNGSSVCLCYFVLRPKILGFPLNSTKLLSLTAVCPLKDKSSKADFSLETLCSGSAALPPLQSITGADSPPPPLRGSAQESSGNSSTEEPAGGNPSTDESAGGSSPTEEPADELPPRPSSSTMPTTISSATQRTFTFTWTLLKSPVYIFTF